MADESKTETMQVFERQTETMQEFERQTKRRSG
jgi:hypothetical protein